MTWFRVDDTLAWHAKVVAAGNAAMGLWVRAGAWSSQQLTDGHIPKHIATGLGTKGEIGRLLASGLWVEAPGGYQFWQWNKDGRQPTKEQVEANRAAARERQRLARERAKSRRDSGVTDAVTSGAVTVPPTRPDPTRPITTNQEGGQRTETLPPTNATQPPHDPTRCKDHQGIDNPPPCRGCKTAREQHERAEKRSRLTVVADCPDCYGSGWLEHPDGRPARKCDHRRNA